MEEVGASSVRIDRKSSIDTEPRTLRIDQIHYAREEALSVMNTRTIEEAMNIFTQFRRVRKMDPKNPTLGLEPVVSVARCNGNAMTDTGEELEHAGDFLPGHRDVVSAPF